VDVYDNERPHQALGGLYPGDVYTLSAQPFRPPEKFEHPFRDRAIKATKCGRLRIGQH